MFINLSLDKFDINTAIFEKEKPLSFAVTVTNHSKQMVNNTVLSIYLNGERAAQQSVSMNPGEIKQIEIDAVAKKTGYIDVIAELEDDEIEHDNKRYISLYIPEKIPVLLSSDIHGRYEFYSACFINRKYF